MLQRALLLFLSLLSPVLSAETLTHLSNIYRAPITSEEQTRLFGLKGFYTIQQPAAIGSYGQYLYIADAFKNIIYRYNRDQETLTPLYTTEQYLQGPVSAFYVNTDLSFYVADPFGNQVLYFDQDGTLLNRFRDRDNLSTPSSLTLNPETGELLVADSLYNHVVVFNPLGTAVAALGNRGTNREPLLHLNDIANGPDGIYLLDQLNKSLYVFSPTGEFRRSQLRNEVTQPSALAIDHNGRIYISDTFDDSIKVYNRDGLIETIGSTGSANGQFRGVSDLYVDRQFLYVADSGNNRIQVFVINTPRSGAASP